MDAVQQAYAALADLNLWMKINASETFSLADLPAMITPRHPVIVDNWSSIKDRLIDSLSDYPNSSELKNQIDAFEKYVTIFRARNDQKINVNQLLNKYFNLFDSMLVNEFPLSPRELKIISDEQTRVSIFNKKDFMDMRQYMVTGSDTIADRMGASDANYNSIYGRSSVPATGSRNLSSISAMNQFRFAITSIEAILANEQILKCIAAIDPFAYARSLTNNPDFDIGSYNSGRLVRLNYGESLQTLSRRTLGNEDKWYDIAIANGLKSPFIDEIGQAIPLISNASGNQLNIASVFGTQQTIDLFYVNQIVMIQSDVEKIPDQRVITSIRVVPISGELVIELNGLSNLDKYKNNENAYVRVYKKNTINSGIYILIPSTESVPQVTSKELPWFMTSKSEDEKRAGIDLALDDSGDLIFTSTGDVQLAYGLDNAIQVLKIMLATVQGSLRRHPEFGIAAVIGQRNPDVGRTRTLIGESISSLVLSDTRFDRLDSLSVEYSSSTGMAGYMVRLGVVLAGGGSSVVPISFSIPAP